MSLPAQNTSVADSEHADLIAERRLCCLCADVVKDRDREDETAFVDDLFHGGGSDMDDVVGLFQFF
jgi:hypothetical protein